MNTSTCQQCGAEVRRRGKKIGRFCSTKCKAEWQRTQKPVDEAWLRQKYIVEELSTYKIAKLVGRNPKQVYEWLVGYGIPTRQRGWKTESTGAPYQSKVWLEREYIERQRAANDIAAEFGVTEANILHYLRKFSIPRRDMASIRKNKYWGLRGKGNGMFGRTGETNPHYTDGSSPERQRLYASSVGKEVIKQVYARDNYRCVRCGAPKTTPRSLHAHHIHSWAGNPELRFDPSNFVTLCRNCHSWVHSKANTNRDFIE